MGGSVWRHLHWLPGSSRFRPDWRLRRAEYLLATGNRLDRHIDDQLIRKARTDLAKGLGRAPSMPDRSTTIQKVHELSRSDSPVRWRLEAFLLTDLSLQEIGAILRQSPEFVGTYHDLAFEVRPRRRATDWLTCRAMGREMSMEHAWKSVARAGGPNVLEVAIAIATGSPLPSWLSANFKNPSVDDAILRMRGKLMIGAMLARTREQWRALVSLRRKLRRLEPTRKVDKREARLQVMLSFLIGMSSNANTLDETQPIRAPEPLTFAMMTPGDPSSQSRNALRDNALSHPAADSSQRRQKLRGHHQHDDAAATHDPEELPHDVVEFMREDAEGTGPLAFAHVEIGEAKWSAFADEQEARTVTVYIHN